MRSTFHTFGWSALAALICAVPVSAQNLPSQLHLSEDGHRLISGGLESDGLYDESIIQKVELQFDQEDYWEQLTSNYSSKTDIPATLVVDGETYEDVGVRFRGNTSYTRVRGEKKSFNVSLDFVDDDQVVGGYNTLNFNNAYEDPSFIREVLYLNLSRNHIPSAKANYIHLYINGESWGLYPNVQQLDGKYLKDWFESNDGTRWRAEKSTSSGGPGGGPGGNPFGTGSSTLNYLGDDTSAYIPNYTLKKANKDNPWDDLVRTCSVLNNVPLGQLEDSLKHYLDIDRTLWFLAHEIVFGDDDSYVNKGGMDYYLYWEVETGRMVPLEYDGNSCMAMSRVSWSPFLNENDSRYPLMNRLFAVPALRQRYLAHVRTIIRESLDQDVVDAKIDAYYDLIDSFVQADDKKIYTYNEFVSARETLKQFIRGRREFLLANSEVGADAPEVSSVMFSAGELEYEAPEAGSEMYVTANVTADQGVQAVNLYYATGIVGSFERTMMYDDGNHGDGEAGDGVFGGAVPGFGTGTYVRFYIEAVAGDNAGTVRYMPDGAEHDVFFYQVKSSGQVASDVVINEFVASNDASAADQDGDYDDWIELYNNSSDPVDLSGWYMSDDEGDITQWTFPSGTVIPGNGYLIVWADEDDDQEGLHANFKLSASGETLLLVQPDEGIADRVDFGEQETDVAYARFPNGTGDFRSQAPTFNATNDAVSSVHAIMAESGTFDVYPNPAQTTVVLTSTSGKNTDAVIVNTLGAVVREVRFRGESVIDISDLAPGIYFVKAENSVRQLVVR